MKRVYWLKVRIAESELCGDDEANAIFSYLYDDIKTDNPKLSHNEVLDIMYDCYPPVACV